MRSMPAAAAFESTVAPAAAAAAASSVSANVQTRSSAASLTRTSRFAISPCSRLPAGSSHGAPCHGAGRGICVWGRLTSATRASGAAIHRIGRPRKATAVVGKTLRTRLSPCNGGSPDAPGGR